VVDGKPKPLSEPDFVGIWARNSCNIGRHFLLIQRPCRAWHRTNEEVLEAVMNLIRNGLGMRKAEDRRGAGQPENPHSNTVFTQVHNTL
jgi:hypothetical protein